MPYTIIIKLVLTCLFKLYILLKIIYIIVCFLIIGIGFIKKYALIFLQKYMLA